MGIDPDATVTWSKQTDTISRLSGAVPPKLVRTVENTQMAIRNLERMLQTFTQSLADLRPAEAKT